MMRRNCHLAAETDKLLAVNINHLLFSSHLLSNLPLKKQTEHATGLYEDKEKKGKKSQTKQTP